MLHAPFSTEAIIFAAAFGALAISFWPWMIPFSITNDEADVPHSSLAFMFWGAGPFVFPFWDARGARDWVCCDVLWGRGCGGRR